MSKRLLCLLLSVLALLALNACGEEPSTPEKTLSEIMGELYTRAKDDYGYAATWNLELIEIPITPDKNDWYFGTEIEYVEALASEYIMMPPAYSVCLVRVRPEDDAAVIAETLLANADPHKWVCTSAGAVAVEHSGDLVLFVMAEKDNTEALRKAFFDLAN